VDANDGYIGLNKAFISNRSLDTIDVGIDFNLTKSSFAPVISTSGEALYTKLTSSNL